MSEVAEPINPYDGFKMLRDHAPVTQIEADGPWQVARHADVQAVMRDHATFSSDVSLQPPEERGAPWRHLRASRGLPSCTSDQQATTSRACSSRRTPLLSWSASTIWP